MDLGQSDSPRIAYVDGVGAVLTPKGAQYIEQLETAIEHVLRYGQLGKQSKRRLKEALDG